MSSIDWSDAAIEAAMDAYGVLREFAEPHEFDAMRAALDAAAELQGLETICYRASERAFEGGRRVGRADALEEAVRLLDRENQPMLADSIRALKEKKG